MTLKHATLTSIADDPAYDVGANEWNADHVVAADFSPVSNDNASLGTATISWSDLFLADGGVINWGNGGDTITHAAASESLTIALDAANLFASTLLNISIDGTTRYVFSTGLSLGSSDLAPGAGNLALSGGKIVATNSTFELNATPLGGVGTVITFSSANAGFLELDSAYGGANGPTIVIGHNSASPASNDTIFSILTYAYNSSAAQILYSRTKYIITDTTASSEDLQIVFQPIIAGSLTDSLIISNGVSVGSTDFSPGTGVLAVSKGVLHSGITFASAPTATAGTVCYFTDSTVNTVGSTITGGGANKVLGWYNGTNWKVVAV